MTLENVKMQAQRDYVNKSHAAVLLRTFTLLMVLILFSFHAEVHALGPIAKSRQEQIDETEKKLRDLKVRWIRLQNKRAQYIQETEDVGGRWGRGTAKMYQTTREHEEALAALDEEMEQAFSKWQLEESVFDITRNKSHFYRTDTYKELNKIHEQKRGELVSKYVARINEIKRKDFEGDPAAITEMDDEQANILLERHWLTQELNKLRSSTDAEIQANEDVIREHFEVQDDPSYFYTNVRIRGEIRIKVGETKKIPIVIGGGVFPVELKIRFGDGRQEYKTFNRRGFIELPFQFSKPGFKPVTLIFEDSSFPKKRSNNAVTFYVVDKDQKPMIQINATTTTTVTVAASTITVPDVIGLEQATAEYDIREAGLQVGNVREQENTQRAGVVIAQYPSGGTEIANVPGANLTVDLTISLEKEVEIPTRAQLSAELDCGDSFELAPGDFAGRGCGIVIQGWRSNTEDRVAVRVDFDRKKGLEIFPGDWSMSPSNMYTAGTTDLHDQYVLSQSFRASSNARPGVYPVRFTVSQPGLGTVRLRLEVMILEPGQTPSSGPGTRPPATVKTGSGGQCCVWRFRSFGDPPNCFHFAAAPCSASRYRQSSYELIGQDMKWQEADAMLARMSRYQKDEYGCLDETAPPPGDGTRYEETPEDQEEEIPDNYGEKIPERFEVDPEENEEETILGGMQLAPGSAKIKPDGSVSFTAIPMDINGEPLQGQELQGLSFEWSVNDPSVANISGQHNTAVLSPIKDGSVTVICVTAQANAFATVIIEAKEQGCTSDSDCEQGYVCDSQSGKCVPLFDDSYAGFSDQLAQRDDQRTWDNAQQVISDQSANTDKDKFTPDDWDQDLDKTQDYVKAQCNASKPCPSGYECVDGKCVKEKPDGTGGNGDTAVSPPPDKPPTTPKFTCKSNQDCWTEYGSNQYYCNKGTGECFECPDGSHGKKDGTAGCCRDEPSQGTGGKEPSQGKFPKKYSGTILITYESKTQLDSAIISFLDNN